MNIKTCIAASGLAVCLLAQSVVAGQLEDGLAAWHQNDNVTAVRLLQPLAEQGIAKAQYSVGMMYFFGSGVPENLVEAAKWYRKAAEQGNLDAQVQLAWLYLRGHGVQQDIAESMKWVRKAAEQGSADHQKIMGIAYTIGDGVPQDYAEAAKWYRRAANQKDAEAQFALGRIYHTGRGTQKDHSAAAKWFRLAAEQDNPSAQFYLAHLYYKGQGVPQDYIEAVKWYRKAAEHGDALSLLKLGQMYAKGLGVPQDFAMAHMWFNLAASTGKPPLDAKGQKIAEDARDALSKAMTPNQIAEAQRLAREWLAALEPKNVENSNFHPDPPLAPDDEMTPDNPSGPSPHYVVDGLALYGKVAFDSNTYLSYSCEPSRFFPTYTWCKRIGERNGPSGAVGTANSILHNMDGDAYYINRSTHPVSFAPGEAQEQIQTLSARFGQLAEIIRMPKTEGYANGLIARWGNLTLTPLTDSERQSLEYGNNTTGTFLIDFLRDDWKKSIRLGLPIYKIGGGAGFLWTVSTSSNGVAQVNVRAADLNAARGFRHHQEDQNSARKEALRNLLSATEDQELDEENDSPED